MSPIKNNEECLCGNGRGERRFSLSDTIGDGLGHLSFRSQITKCKSSRELLSVYPAVNGTLPFLNV